MPSKSAPNVSRSSSLPKPEPFNAAPIIISRLIPSKESHLETDFREAWDRDYSPLGAQYALFEQEQTFHPVRRWRFDFCWHHARLAVELEGAAYTGGRHTRGAGFTEDCNKYNQAIILGWRVLRFTSKHLLKANRTETLDLVKLVLDNEAIAM